VPSLLSPPVVSKFHGLGFALFVTSHSIDPPLVISPRFFLFLFHFWPPSSRNLSVFSSAESGARLLCWIVFALSVCEDGLNFYSYFSVF